MRVLVIGSGAREHALCWALSHSPRVEKLYCGPGNGGTGDVAENVPLNPMDADACATWAERAAIDLTIIGPEDPLAAGIADVFTARGLSVFGPSAAAARIESSKIWAKQLMERAGVPTASALRFTDYSAARHAIERRAADGGAFPVVVKADGLAAGKGVIIAKTEREALAAVERFMRDQSLGQAGASVLIEDFLEGTELSLFALTDGERVVPLAPACDYKRVNDGDEGREHGRHGRLLPATLRHPRRAGGDRAARAAAHRCGDGRRWRAISRLALRGPDDDRCWPVRH